MNSSWIGIVLVVFTVMGVGLGTVLLASKQLNGSSTNGVLCFEENMCVMQVDGVWYKVDGIVDIDKITPPEFKLPPKK